MIRQRAQTACRSAAAARDNAGQALRPIGG